MANALWTGWSFSTRGMASITQPTLPSCGNGEAGRRASGASEGGSCRMNGYTRRVHEPTIRDIRDFRDFAGQHRGKTSRSGSAENRREFYRTGRGHQGIYGRKHRQETEEELLRRT